MGYASDLGREYQRKPVRVRAMQWHKLGDHPDEGTHSTARRGMVADPKDDQGWIVVYPGDWILDYEDGTRDVCSDAQFRSVYEEVMPPPDVLAALVEAFEDREGVA